MAYAPALDLTTLFEVILRLNPLDAEAKFWLLASNIGRGGGGGGYPPPPPTVYGRSSTHPPPVSNE